MEADMTTACETMGWPEAMVAVVALASMAAIVIAILWCLTRD